MLSTCDSSELSSGIFRLSGQDLFMCPCDGPMRRCHQSWRRPVVCHHALCGQNVNPTRHRNTKLDQQRGHHQNPKVTCITCSVHYLYVWKVRDFLVYTWIPWRSGLCKLNQRQQPCGAARISVGRLAPSWRCWSKSRGSLYAKVYEKVSPSKAPVCPLPDS